MKLLLRIFVLIVFSMFIVSCTSVSPWERGILAKPEMAWEPDPLMGQLQEHVYFSKEGSSGGYGAGGGGCGCN
ncbi:MAG: DUF4266 domain-containing protein [Gammaproteobacteria bacterium]